MRERDGFYSYGTGTRERFRPVNCEIMLSGVTQLDKITTMVDIGVGTTTETKYEVDGNRCTLLCCGDFGSRTRLERLENALTETQRRCDILEHYVLELLEPETQETQNMQESDSEDSIISEPQSLDLNQGRFLLDRGLLTHTSSKEDPFEEGFKEIDI